MFYEIRNPLILEQTHCLRKQNRELVTTTVQPGNTSCLSIFFKPNNDINNEHMVLTEPINDKIYLKHCYDPKVFSLSKRNFISNKLRANS
jgi:hypothetical protein